MIYASLAHTLLKVNQAAREKLRAKTDSKGGGTWQ